ncbi:hypothetical protein ACPV5W_08575 [Vibrio astriarenae]
MNNKIAVAIVGAGIVSGCSVSPEYDKSVGEQNSKMVEVQMGLYQKHQLD